MEGRYERNLGIITPEEQRQLSDKKVLIVGAGGLGGNVVEYLARAGVGTLAVCDGDVFEDSNLNRQLLATEEVIGKNKALCAKNRALSVNSAIKVITYEYNLNESNAAKMLRGCSLAVDALDSVEARLLLERECAALGVTLVHAAVGGLQGQVMTVPVGSGLLSCLYEGAQTAAKPSVTAYSAAVVAGCEAAEAVNVLLGRPKLVGRLLVIDLCDFSVETLKLS